MTPLDAETFETLLDWVDGRLPPERAAHAARIADTDARSRAIVEWLRGFTAVGRALPLEHPPPIVRQRLNDHFERWRDDNRAIEEEISRFDATVLFDGRRRLAPAGVRGTDTDEVLHLAYTAATADLVLDVVRVPGHRLRIDGQVLLAEPGRAPVFEATATGPGFSIRTVDGDEFGRFRLDEVPDTAEHLQVTNGEIMVTAHLDLRPDVP